jgi:hypothetical protein
MKNILIKVAYLFLSSVIFNGSAIGQTKDSSTITLSGYVDVYYARYSDSVGTNNYSKFPDISAKDNSFGLNIFQLSVHYNSGRLRATGTMHYGDLPSSAWSPQFNLLQEANIGFKLTNKLWIDAGLFKTHIGTEGLLPKDNITSSMSVITYYEPWWQAGVKATYNYSDKLQLVLHLLNGYNTFISINKAKAIGISASYNINSKANISYFNLLSDNSPDSVKTSHFRFLNNLVFNYQFNSKLKALLGADLISQKNTALSDPKQTAFIYSLIATLRYELKPKLGVYGRFELYNDGDGFLTGIITDENNKLTGLKLSGYTLGAEYKTTENSFIRLEGRALLMDKDQKIFYTDGKYTNIRTELMITAGVWF